MNDPPEVPVGGRRHLAFEQRSDSCVGGVGAEGLNVRGVSATIRTPAEPVELGRVLFICW